MMRREVVVAELISSHFIICVIEWRCPLLRSHSVSASEGEAMLEWYWQGEKPKYSDRNPSQCHFFHHKSHVNWPGIEPVPPPSETGHFADKRRRASVSVDGIGAENWTWNLSNVKQRFHPVVGSKNIWISGLHCMLSWFIDSPINTKL